MLRRTKLEHLDGKKMACFTSNLMQNLLNLAFFLKASGSGEKMGKTKVVWKNANWRRSEAKG